MVTGQARAEFLPVVYNSEIVQAFREFKSAWDPQWRNPSKVVDPYPMDTNFVTTYKSEFLAEVIQMALHQRLPRKLRYIEIGRVEEEPSYPLVTAMAGAGLLLVGGMLLMDRLASGPRATLPASSTLRYPDAAGSIRPPRLPLIAPYSPDSIL